MERQPHDEQARLAASLSRGLGVDGVTIADLDVPSAGHSGDMRSFTARWTDGGQDHSRRLIARIQPREASALFLDADITTQAWIMELVASHSSVPVPPILMTETSPTVFGAPFFVMAQVPGRVPPDEPCYHVAGFLADELDIAARRRLWLGATGTLADIHKITVPDADQSPDVQVPRGLDQYLDWVERWYHWVQRGRAHEVMDAALDQLLTARPTTTDHGVIWGDARIGNMIFADDHSVAAVIDWEMAAAGPGEIDLGWWLVMDRLASDGLGYPRLAGLPDRDETIAHYESVRGRSTRDLDYYELLAAFRFATVLLRVADLFAGTPLLDADTTFGTNSHAVREVAALMDLPQPALSPDVAKVLKQERRTALASTSGQR